MLHVSMSLCDLCTEFVYYIHVIVEQLCMHVHNVGGSGTGLHFTEKWYIGLLFVDVEKVLFSYHQVFGES